MRCRSDFAANVFRFNVSKNKSNSTIPNVNKDHLLFFTAEYVLPQLPSPGAGGRTAAVGRWHLGGRRKKGNKSVRACSGTGEAWLTGVDAVCPP